MKNKKSLLPWYINNSLSADEKASVADWLQRAPEGLAETKATKQIAAAAKAQESQYPAKQTEAALFAKIAQTRQAKSASMLQWAWGIPIVIALFALLWVIVQPGTQLQWATNGENPAAFRIYRAPAGSSTFELLDELPVSTAQNTYHYADKHILPGSTYYYVIEIIDQSGRTNLSPAISNGTMGNFANQIAILLASFTLTFGIITVLTETKVKKLFISFN